MQYTDVQVYDAIKSGFVNLKKLARADLKKYWKTLTREQKFAAGRALVFMDGVAQNPEKYFSRANTQAAWQFRADYFADKMNIKDVADAYYIVEDPQGIVWNRVQGAMRGELNQEYYRFCHAVQQWEYDRTSNKEIYRAGAPKFAAQIVDKSKRYQEMLGIKTANPIVRPIKQIMFQFQR